MNFSCNSKSEAIYSGFASHLKRIFFFSRKEYLRPKRLFMELHATSMACEMSHQITVIHY